MGSEWPSHKASYVRAKILGKGLGYVAEGKWSGSHVWLVAEGRPRIRWGYHNKRSLAPREIKRILIEDAGLTLEEAKEVLGL